MDFNEEEPRSGRRYVLLLALLVLSLAGAWAWLWLDEEPAPVLVVADTGGEALPGRSQAQMVVYIVGAVKRPGVYDVPVGSRVYELVNAAGDVLPYADMESVNMSAELTDGEKVYIPINPNRVSITTEPVVNINNAEKAELMTLPGVGEATAQKILDYRAQHGPFQNKRDLMNVSSIGEARYKRIEDKITL